MPQKKLSIALYNLTTTTKVGGVESFVWDLSRELAKRGHNVTIIGGVGDQREVTEGVRVITYPFINRSFWQALPPLRRSYAEAKLLERLSMSIAALPQLIRGGYDIVHLQKPYDMAPALLARMAGGPRVVLGCHGEDFYRGDWWLARQVDAAVSCSRFNARTVGARYDCAIQVIFNGFDSSLFSAPSARPCTPQHVWRWAFVALCGPIDAVEGCRYCAACTPPPPTGNVAYCGRWRRAGAVATAGAGVGRYAARAVSGRRAAPAVTPAL